jgi:hypothetical protein
MQISPFLGLYELDGGDLVLEGDFIADPNKLLAGQGFEMAVSSVSSLIGMVAPFFSWKCYRRMEDPGTSQGYVAISPHTLIQQLDVIKAAGTDPKFIPAYTYFVGKTLASMYSSGGLPMIWRPDPTFFPIPSAMPPPNTSALRQALLALEAQPPLKLSLPAQTWTCNSPRCRNRQNDVGHVCYWCGSTQR